MGKTVRIRDGRVGLVRINHVKIFPSPADPCRFGVRGLPVADACIDFDSFFCLHMVSSTVVMKNFHDDSVI